MLKQKLVRTSPVANLKVSYQICSSSPQTFWNLGVFCVKLRFYLIFPQSVVLERLYCLLWIHIFGEDIVKSELAGKDVHHDLNCVWVYRLVNH